MQQTLAALDRVGIKHSGAGMTLDEAWLPAAIETSNGKIAVLAFSMTFPKEFWATDSTGGTAYPFEKRLRSALDSLKNNSDFIILSFHWGKEKSTVPKQYQQYFAHYAIDHGADLIIGHHPHVLQGMEIYKGKLIAYSLGNLAFSAYSRTAVNSALLRVMLDSRGKLLYGQILPLNVDNAEVEFQPRLAEPVRKRQILSELDSLSYQLTGRDIISESGLIFDFLPPDTARAIGKPFEILTH